MSFERLAGCSLSNDPRVELNELIGKKVKQVMLRVGNSKRWRVNKEGKGRQIWLVYFLYMEYGALKPVEVTSRRGIGEEGD
jgi:hypothetical protein